MAGIFKKTYDLIRKALINYKKDDPIRLAGTTAYFAIFAMAPIVIILISILSLVLEQERVTSTLYEEIRRLLGENGTEYIKSIVENYNTREKSIWATVIGLAIFMVTSTTFFTVLQKSLNFVWKIQAKPKRGIFKSFKDRLLSFGLILSLGFIMLVTLMVEAIMSYLKDYINDYFPAAKVVFIELTNITLSLAVLTLIFALIFRFLPDAIIRWKTTWVGAFITAVLFEAGRALIGVLLRNSNIGVLYGAAGSLVVILLWVFYSSIIFFFGAEITQQFALMTDRRIRPKDYAVKIQITEEREE